MRVSDKDWGKNDCCVLEKLGIIKFTGNQWNESYEFPHDVSKKVADKLRQGYYQRDCKEMKDLYERMEKWDKERNTPEEIKPIDSDFEKLRKTMYNMGICLRKAANAAYDAAFDALPTTYARLTEERLEQHADEFKEYCAAHGLSPTSLDAQCEFAISNTKCMGIDIGTCPSRTVISVTDAKGIVLESKEL